jgi:hypothetical protein
MTLQRQSGTWWVYKAPLWTLASHSTKHEGLKVLHVILMVHHEWPQWLCSLLECSTCTWLWLFPEQFTVCSVVLCSGSVIAPTEDVLHARFICVSVKRENASRSTICWFTTGDEVLLTMPWFHQCGAVHYTCTGLLHSTVTTAVWTTCMLITHFLCTVLISSMHVVWVMQMDSVMRNKYPGSSHKKRAPFEYMCRYLYSISYSSCSLVSVDVSE